MQEVAPPGSTRLIRSLTLTHAVLYGLGVTIGAGIYVLVGAAAARSGMHAPLAFLAAAVVMGVTAGSFAELGTRLPVAASEAAYVQAAFHRKWLSGATGLLVVAAATISGATITVGSAGYISVFLPLPASWIIAGVVLAMGAVACLSAVQSISFAGLMTVVEIGGLVLIVGAGLFQGDALVSRLPELLVPLSDKAAWTGIAQTSLLAVFAFIGFEHLVNISEEMKNPPRTLPWALFITLGVTAFLYMTVVWVAVVAVPPAELAHSSAPLALVFQRLTGLPLSVLSVIAIVATVNGIIVHMLMIGRVLYGLADQGSLPAFLARVNARSGSPVVATLFGVGAILILALGIPLTGLAEWTSRLTLGAFVLVNLALLRIKTRESKPPAGVFLVPIWVPIAGLFTSAALLLIDLLA
ncbi:MULTISPECIES: APC family permease [unclassified Bradyrhizobium]|uniref:APC family permease n=1 Tax=unclassified Bradyrhizobium TaxID=2631580 RepID=UPI00211E02F7|nr:MULTISPECIES: APC family permease [unclassified Bradyrhizobium]MDD1533586.1 amino acid permease [Bradyrhizobium sp. WBOS8]MDD1582069.1 amino acid permease [Bradyrhizobium sp. WBOS4]UUO47353.1 amino acid permease [Bradyrhizobium sp. WBOS04]UUO60970.1 amino acid permease [Bradyrhizobium sp. WBOS08]